MTINSRPKKQSDITNYFSRKKVSKPTNLFGIATLRPRNGNVMNSDNPEIGAVGVAVSQQEEMGQMSLSEMGDEALNDEINGDGYGRGYDNHPQPPTAMEIQAQSSVNILREIAEMLKRELTPLSIRIDEGQNEMRYLAGDMAGVQAGLLNLRNSTEVNQAEAERQIDVLSRQMESMCARMAEMEERMAATEQRVVTSELNAAAASAAFNERANAVLQETQNAALRANLAAVEAEQRAPAAADSDLSQREITKLRELIRRMETEDINFWKRTMLISGLPLDVNGKSAYDQARRQLRRVGLEFLVDECERLKITGAGNVRMLFPSVATAYYMLNSVKRNLARHRGQHRVVVDLLVPPEFVPDKKEMLALGKRLKQQGLVDSFDVTIVQRVLKLRTIKRGEPARFYTKNELANLGGGQEHMELDVVSDASNQAPEDGEVVEAVADGAAVAVMGGRSARSNPVNHPRPRDQRPKLSQSQRNAHRGGVGYM